MPNIIKAVPILPYYCNFFYSSFIPEISSSKFGYNTEKSIRNNNPNIDNAIIDGINEKIIPLNIFI